MLDQATPLRTFCLPAILFGREYLRARGARLFAFVFATVAVHIGWILSAPATILTFEISNDRDVPMGTAPQGHEFTSLSPKYADYGNRVSSDMQFGEFTYHYGEGTGFTPNISLSYGATEKSSIGYYNDKDWPQVAYLGTSFAQLSPRSFFLTFTPDPGYGVKINSFELFGYKDAIHHGAEWTIHKGSPEGEVLDSGVIDIEGNYQEGRAIVTTSGAVYDGTVVLEINHTRGSSGGFAMDNVNFDQVKLPKETK